MRAWRIEFCRRKQENMMQSRKVVTRSGGGFRGYFPSKKVNRMVSFESLLERDAIYLFEHSPGVSSYQEQPEKIMYEHEGIMRKYYPDFEVLLNSGKVFHIEVKPKSKLQQRTLQSKFKAIIQRYESHPASFMILTEDAIRKEPLHSNLKTIDRCKSLHGNCSHTISDVTDCIQNYQQMTFSQLAEKFGHKLILNLLANYQLVCDLSLPLTAMNNHVNLVKEADYAAVLF